ncbi:hypothetical protein [Pseudonocardia sp.]|uniref:hypothetical protein n=1 Tax=Pseudonocardia sp. TaxID=60912 RepID=UPI003D1443E6
METSSCPLCGLHRTIADLRALAWTSQHAPDGSVSWICPACTRAQLFAIEAGLPLERAQPLPWTGRRAA